MSGSQGCLPWAGEDAPEGRRGIEAVGPALVQDKNPADVGAPVKADSDRAAAQKAIGPLFQGVKEGGDRRELVPFDVSLLALSGVKGLGRTGLAALVDALEGELGRVWHADPMLIRGILVEAKVRAADRMTSEILQMAPVLLSRGQEKAAELSEKGVRVIAPRGLLRWGAWRGRGVRRGRGRRRSGGRPRRPALAVRARES